MKSIFPEPIHNLPEADIPLSGIKAFLSQDKNHQIIFMEFEEDVLLPEHSHAAQVGIVIKGKIDLAFNNECKTYEKGDVYYIPSGVKHSGKIYAGYSDVTFFDEPNRYKQKQQKMHNLKDAPATDKRILLVTGGSRGIGAAIARQGAAEGYAVCVNYRSSRDAAEAVVADINAAGGTAVAIQADVAVEGEVVRLFAEIDARLGRITALVNNAGILERQARVEEMDAARIGRVFGANVTGSFICCREAVRRMSTRHGGSGGVIVNISSRAGRLGAPGEYVDYAASKAAVDTLTIGLAKEVAAEGIRVNAVCPGIIYTDIHASGGEPGRVERLKDSIPMKRGGYPEEVARAVLWLLSDAASYTTGTLLDVSGGR